MDNSWMEQMSDWKTHGLSIRDHQLCHSHSLSSSQQRSDYTRRKEEKRANWSYRQRHSVPGTNQRFMVHTDKKRQYKLLTTRKIDNGLTMPEQRSDEYNIEIKEAH